MAREREKPRCRLSLTPITRTKSPSPLTSHPHNTERVNISRSLLINPSTPKLSTYSSSPQQPVSEYDSGFIHQLRLRSVSIDLSACRVELHAWMRGELKDYPCSLREMTNGPLGVTCVWGKEGNNALYDEFNYFDYIYLRQICQPLSTCEIILPPPYLHQQVRTAWVMFMHCYPV